MASNKMYHPGMKSNMRLTLKVNRGIKDTYHYDVGIGAIEDPQNRLSQFNEALYPVEPRFLEDYIGHYGKGNVSVHEWGKYEEKEIKEHKDFGKNSHTFKVLSARDIAEAILA